MKRYAKKENIVYVNICGEHLLVKTDSQDGDESGAAVINESAAALWQRIEKPMTFQQLNTAASEYYGADMRSSFLPTISFITKMTEAGFLTIVDENREGVKGTE